MSGKPQERLVINELKKMLDPYELPQLEIVVDDSLGFTVKVFGFIFTRSSSVPPVLSYSAKHYCVQLNQAIGGVQIVQGSPQGNLVANCFTMSYL